MSSYPSKEEFINFSKDFNLIPVYKEVIADLDTPVSAFIKLGESNYSFLLESVEGGERWGRYSFLGINPYMVATCSGGIFKLEGRKNFTQETKDPLVNLKEIMDQYKPAPVTDLPPFHGGAVGYLGYDSIRYFENIPKTGKDDFQVPELLFMFTDSVLIFDHLKHKIKVLVNVHLDGDMAPEAAYDAAVDQIDILIDKLAKPAKLPWRDFSVENKLDIKSNVTEEQFIKAVEKAKQYIVDGDVIQVVLSQRFSFDLPLSVFDIYRVLRTVNPSPYMYYLKLNDLELVGSSPEPLVKVEGNNVLTRPIAGTRRRGLNDEEDILMENELKEDEKEKAEHLMLVDLGRNDLGRVCIPGSVKVDDFMSVEKYSHVMHLVSNVIGKLRDDKDAYDALRSVFPAGTVSGAPKIRAMEIIDELEPTLRGPYAGCVGYFSYSGNLDSCITIRTLMAKGDKGFLQAGAGIVYDSDPKAEFKETQNKAKALLQAVRLAH
jgi:anthranilate synthase component 1